MLRVRRAERTSSAAGLLVSVVEVKSRERLSDESKRRRLATKVYMDSLRGAESCGEIGLQSRREESGERASVLPCVDGRSTNRAPLRLETSMGRSDCSAGSLMDPQLHWTASDVGRADVHWAFAQRLG